ncbi:MAG TPA: N-acyl homoserine lactonase family protein [Casimicrobiaceae bacterium]|nr:N-acyl homoserine lactonase family protein [Casimicrobiaceae bacterium]
MTTYSIHPLEIGRRRADSALFMFLTDPGVEIEIAYRLWVLRSGEQLFVVDTGPPLEEAHRRGITRVREIDEALAEVGVRGEDVRTVVLTHLHWDHAANAAKFPNAVYLAQRGEIEFFRSHAREHPAMNRFFSHQAYLGTLIDQGRIRPIDGDQPIAPGLTAMRVGGHTPGSQMLVVDAVEGTSVITGDAIPLHRNYLENIPSGIVVNTLEAIAALERVRALRPAVIYTGHDLQPCLKPA